MRNQSRRRRDAAHLADGIDANLQDATLVAVLDWVLAELVRLHHGVGAGEAHGIVEDLVTRRAPVIQDVDARSYITNLIGSCTVGRDPSPRWPLRHELDAGASGGLSESCVDGG